MSRSRRGSVAHPAPATSTRPSTKSAATCEFSAHGGGQRRSMSCQRDCRVRHWGRLTISANHQYVSVQERGGSVSRSRLEHRRNRHPRRQCQIIGHKMSHALDETRRAGHIGAWNREGDGGTVRQSDGNSDGRIRQACPTRGATIEKPADQDRRRHHVSDRFAYLAKPGNWFLS